ncbi:hypothetical protein SAMN05444483_10976 [Salegentibacter echinorum]|uniref:SatD family (SatD) n=1 Tax=Salegentibacter echinorum TaxID=1073325 RepID=A0A1M5J1M6_SALEC|nr:hypothetical protein [Salegentibacter echinorum]SHG34411.1 hypothetical protein SAMN05444483_10976 [Salegentibacter echinorum]
MIAVITADLIDSSLYSRTLLNNVLKVLNAEFDNVQQECPNDDLKFKIYRGDSFQGVTTNLKLALQIALRLKSCLNKIKVEREEEVSRVDAKFAIGIGSFDFKAATLAESNGQAFQFSGRTLDEMKNDTRRIRLKTTSENINAEFEASLFLLDAIMEKWSRASAEVVYYLLLEMKETEIAEALSISQSAVNQRKKACGWEAISVLLKRFKTTVAETF